jgi:flagellar motor switch/type III secretory pathway protein FliN
MSSLHEIVKCKHGTVIRQCRCPGPKVEIIVNCPPSCKTA